MRTSARSKRGANSAGGRGRRADMRADHAAIAPRMRRRRRLRMRAILRAVMEGSGSRAFGNRTRFGFPPISSGRHVERDGSHPFSRERAGWKEILREPVLLGGAATDSRTRTRRHEPALHRCSPTKDPDEAWPSHEVGRRAPLRSRGHVRGGPNPDGSGAPGGKAGRARVNVHPWPSSVRRSTRPPWARATWSTR